jgi:tight adherence protein C
MTMLLPALAFLFATAIVALVGMRFAGARGSEIDRRLAEVTTARELRDAPPRLERVTELLKSLGARAPRSGSEASKVKQRLVQAGYRGDEAVAIFYGLRISIALAAFGLLATPLLVRPSVMLGLGGSLLAYVLPGIVLAKLAARRQRRMQLSLADALDLMVVSVEAGLGLDQALLGSEPSSRPRTPICRRSCGWSTSSCGPARHASEALRNLGERTGLEDVTSLVTMLVQTDKFGTSVAQSLRVHSDVLRTKRRQRAEEAAAKTGVKMVFPLVFCIFPAIWVVTIGPAAIKFVEVLFPMAQRGGQ